MLLFSTEANYIIFFEEDNKDKKYYKGNISPSMAIVLSHYFILHPSIKNLYYKGKGTNC
jgi:hypothetical protein